MFCNLFYDFLFFLLLLVHDYEEVAGWTIAVSREITILWLFRNYGFSQETKKRATKRPAKRKCPGGDALNLTALAIRWVIESYFLNALYGISSLFSRWLDTAPNEHLHFSHLLWFHEVFILGYIFSHPKNVFAIITAPRYSSFDSHKKLTRKPHKSGEFSCQKTSNCRVLMNWWSGKYRFVDWFIFNAGYFVAGFFIIYVCPSQKICSLDFWFLFNYKPSIRNSRERISP